MRDIGLDVLLDLNGTEYTEENGYWYKIEAWKVDPTKERPHGIRYNLTFHDNYNKRIMGFDNAHLPPNRKKGYKGRIVQYDHAHEHHLDKGTAYEFKNATQLLGDFFDRVNEIISELQKGEIMAMLKIGVMPREKFQQRILDIASGKYKPKRNEPKVWFHSMKSIGELLNDKNILLLKIIEEEKPDSLKILSELSGRQVSNLSRTLHKMATYGIVKLEKNRQSIKPIAKATEFNIMCTA